MRPGPNVKNVMDDRSYEPPEQPVPVFTRKTAGKTVVVFQDEVPAPMHIPSPVEAAPAAVPGGAPGRKDDSAKRDVTLFFNDLPHAIYAVTEVLQWAITKKQPVPYERGSWQSVPDFQRRYQAAGLRHELNRAIARIEGQVEEPRDDETDLMELAHIAACAMFRLEMACRKAKGLPTPEGA